MSGSLLAARATGPDAPAWRFARLLRVTVAKVILAVYRTRVIGVENVPATGGFILAGNHVSYLDPVVLWCAAARETHFIAKQELFDIPGLTWPLAHIWSFPIRRGTADRRAIEWATDLLRNGEPVAMFPEGTRQRSGSSAPLGEAHSGVAFIALRADVPVVPVGIAGTDRALPPGARLPRFPKVTIAYGPPVCPADFAQGARKERTAALTAEIMSRIAHARDQAEGAS